MLFWGCPQMNKFEQVFSDDHQMSLAEGGWGLRGQGLMPRGWGGGLYNDVQYIMGNGHMRTLPPVNR